MIFTWIASEGKHKHLNICIYNNNYFTRQKKQNVILTQSPEPNMLSSSCIAVKEGVYHGAIHRNSPDYTPNPT